jgi:hypothetical protein
MTAPDDPAALTELQALFASLPPDEMPDDVTERVLGALAELPESRTEPAPVSTAPVSIDTYRARRRRTRRILTAAAAVLLVAGGTVGLVELARSSSTAATSSSGAAAGTMDRASTGESMLARPGPQADSYLPTFTLSDLRVRVSALVAVALPTASYPQAVAACVSSGFQGGATPIAAEQGWYQNQSALLLVYQDRADANRVDAFLVATPCTASGPRVLWNESITK